MKMKIKKIIEKNQLNRQMNKKIKIQYSKKKIKRKKKKMLLKMIILLIIIKFKITVFIQMKKTMKN